MSKWPNDKMIKCQNPHRFMEWKSEKVITRPTAWSANFKMVWYVLCPPATSEAVAKLAWAAWRTGPTDRTSPAATYSSVKQFQMRIYCFRNSIHNLLIKSYWHPCIVLFIRSWSSLKAFWRVPVIPSCIFDSAAAPGWIRGCSPCWIRGGRGARLNPW
jgi:hypothetical protein